jgi:hypothetical protein
MPRRRNKNDEGASLIIVLGLIGGLMTMVAALLPYAATNIMSSAKFKAHVDSSYQVDGSLKIALTGVRSTARGSNPCLSYPQSLNGRSVECSSTVPATSLLPTGGAIPGVTPARVDATLRPGQSMSLPSPQKTVFAPVITSTAASGFSCSNPAYPGRLHTVSNSPSTNTSVVSMPAGSPITTADVGNQIFITSNNGNCGQSGRIYTITAVSSGSLTQLTISPQYVWQIDRDVNWSVVASTPPTVTTQIVTPGTCPSTVVSVVPTQLGTPTWTPQGMKFTFSEVFSVVDPLTVVLSTNPYQCDVQFHVTGTSSVNQQPWSADYVESNNVTVIASTTVNFTVCKTSSVPCPTSDVAGRTSASYDDRTSARIPTITSWHLL